MKTPKWLVTGIALLAGGCVFVPSPYSEQLNPAADRYRAIQRGTPRETLETQFGPGSQADPRAPYVWETRFDKLNYASVKVWFDRDDKAEKIEVTCAHGKSLPGYYGSAVSIRSK